MPIIGPELTIPFTVGEAEPGSEAGTYKVKSKLATKATFSAVRGGNGYVFSVTIAAGAVYGTEDPNEGWALQNLWPTALEPA